MNYEWEKTDNSDIRQQETAAEQAAENTASAPKASDPEVKIVYSDPQTRNQAPAPKKKSGAKKALLIILCVVLFGAAAGGAFYGIKWLAEKSGSAISQNLPQPQGGENQIPGQPPQDTPQLPGSDDPKTGSGIQIDNTNTGNGLVTGIDVSGLVEETMPSLVQITAVEMVSTSDYYTNPFYFFFGGGNSNPGGTQEARKSLGSGVIVGSSDDELFIVTNAHVTDGADNLSVTFEDGESCDAYLKGSDSDIDVALICVKISEMKQTTLDSIKIAAIGDSDTIKIGQQVVAIGNALGYGQSVTTGIISALNRTTTTSTKGLIQTDAAINPGNSGGALFNINGELIGINNSKSVDYEVEGIGYAIPINEVMPLVEEYEQARTRVKVDESEASFLGINGADIDSQAAQVYNMPTGIYITALVANGPCEQAGVPERCVITKLDGQSVSNMTKLKDLLTYYAAGETVDLTVQELINGQYEEHVYQVTLGKASDFNQNTQPTQPARP